MLYLLLLHCFAIWKSILQSQSQLCLNAIQFPATFLKRESPAAPPGTTEISLHGNVAYESYNRGEDQDDDHQYEKLDEYKP